MVLAISLIPRDVKYFFLSDGWTTDRVWEFGGLWNEAAWQRKPHIQKLDLLIKEQSEKLWLFQVEDDVLMIEVKPESTTDQPIGQVVLKRLITAEQVINKLCQAEVVTGTSLLSLNAHGESRV